MKAKNPKIKTILRNGKKWFKVQGFGPLFASIKSAQMHIDNK